MTTGLTPRLDAGLVTAGTQTIAGAKTFSGAITPTGGIVGKTDGVAVAAGYVGERFSATTGNNYPTSANTPTTLASFTLNKGKYLVGYTTYWFGDGGAYRIFCTQLYTDSTAISLVLKSTMTTHSGQNNGGNLSDTFPISIDSDGVTLSVKGYWQTNGATTVENGSQLWAIRIA